jgi:hypothetical protein
MTPLLLAEFKGVVRRTAHLCFAMVLALVAHVGYAAELPRVPSPAALDVPYSADNPPGPSFTDSEKQHQFAEGARILAGIREAFRTGKDSYVIPPGDYRFDSVYRELGGRSFALHGMHADPAKPFRIIGYGATFWFGLSEHPAPHYHHMVKVVDCSHLSLEGIIVDSDPRGSMDARITAFDLEGNRIQVKPVAGTRLLERMPASEGRFIPYKADGKHVAALYQVDEGWGPGNVFYVKMERTADGLYWFTLKSRKLLETIRNEGWRKAYGSAGILEVGDMLGFLYSTSAAISISRCRQITVRDARFFAAKAGLDESGGYGAHRWINCHFMARPGTNNLLGGDGVMSACMHGSTFERRVVQRTTDDAFNNHGHWRHAVSADENRITFKETLPFELAAGHVAEAYDTRNEAYLGRLTVESVEGRTVVFREPLGSRFFSCAVMFPAFQNAGWVIRDSIFSDCYQRVLLGCGPGLFEGNRLERVGAGLTLGNGRPVDIEGGDPHGVVIRGNIFLDSATSPALRAIRVRGTGAPVRGLEVSGNLFIGSGSGALHLDHVDGAIVRDNLMLKPAVGAGLLPAKGEPAAITLKKSRGGEVVGNRLLGAGPALEVVRSESSEGVRIEGNQTIAVSADLAARIAQRMRKHEESTAAIIKDVRAETTGK